MEKNHIVGNVYLEDGSTRPLHKPYSFEKLVDDIFFSDMVPVSSIVLMFEQDGKSVQLDISPARGLAITIDDIRLL
jgi:hypothetical protein